MKKEILLLFLSLGIYLTSCTTIHNNYFYADGEKNPTENAQEAINNTNQKKVITLGWVKINMSTRDKKILSTQASKEQIVEAAVPEFNILEISGSPEFLIDDLAQIDASGNILINITYNKIKEYSDIVLRLYTSNEAELSGLVGGDEVNTVDLYVKTDGLLIDNTLTMHSFSEAGLYDYVCLDSWGSDPRANNPLGRAIKVSNLALSLMGDFSDAISQYYSTTIIIEIAGVLK